jgi:hypothetical protein
MVVVVPVGVLAVVQVKGVLQPQEVVVVPVVDRAKAVVVVEYRLLLFRVQPIQLRSGPEEPLVLELPQLPQTRQVLVMLPGVRREMVPQRRLVRCIHLREEFEVMPPPCPRLVHHRPLSAQLLPETLTLPVVVLGVVLTPLVESVHRVLQPVSGTVARPQLRVPLEVLVEVAEVVLLGVNQPPMETPLLELTGVTREPLTQMVVREDKGEYPLTDAEVPVVEAVAEAVLKPQPVLQGVPEVTVVPVATVVW